MVSEGDFRAHVVTAATATAADDDDRRLRIRHLLFASTRISFLGRALLYDCCRCCCCCWFTFFFGCPVEGAIYYISHRIQPCRSGSNMIFSVFLFFSLSSFLHVDCIAFASHAFFRRDDSCRCTAFVLMYCYNSIDSRKFVWWHCFRATLACFECMFFPAQTGCVTFDPVFAFVGTMTAISGEKHNTDEDELRTNNIQIRFVIKVQKTRSFA